MSRHGDACLPPCIDAHQLASRTHAHRTFRLVGRIPHLTISNSPCLRTKSFPRRVCARGLIYFHPDEGWAERRQAPGCSGIRWTCHNAARRGACEAPLRPVTRDARLSALHHGDFGSGARASISGIASRSVQRSSSQPGRSAWRAGFPNLPRPRLRAAAAERHSLLRLQDRL